MPQKSLVRPGTLLFFGGADRYGAKPSSTGIGDLDISQRIQIKRGILGKRERFDENHHASYGARPCCCDFSLANVGAGALLRGLHGLLLWTGERSGVALRARLLWAAEMRRRKEKEGVFAVANSGRLQGVQPDIKLRRAT